jgi:hypothetical protein
MNIRKADQPNDHIYLLNFEHLSSYSYKILQTMS